MMAKPIQDPTCGHRAEMRAGQLLGWGAGAYMPLSPQQPQAQPYTTLNPPRPQSASPDALKFKLQKQLLSQAT